MATVPRFQFDEPRRTLGDRLLGNVTELKIHLMSFKDDDGGRSIFCDVETCGTLNLSDDAGGENFALLSGLLRQFRRLGEKGGQSV